MTTVAEPEWDEDTRDLVLGLDGVDLCPACGGPAYLCQDPANEFKWQIPAPVRCHRKTALTQAQRRVTEQTNPIPEALLWRVVLSDGSTDG
jgi:hypothetical protein